MKLTFIVLCMVISAVMFAQNRLLNHPPEIQKMEVDITADELMAKTVVTITVVNNTKLQMENYWCFNVAPNTRITDFKLDLYGTFRDASIDETWKVTNAYNTVVGKRMDPAILRKTNETSYCINVYPVEPGQTRRLQFTMLQLLENKAGNMHYKMPISFDKIDTLITNIKVDSANLPSFETGLFENNLFTKDGDFSFKNIALNLLKPKDIDIKIAKSNNTNYSIKTTNNHFLANLPKTNTNAFEVNGKHISLFFDVSINNANRIYQKEVDALDALFKFHRTVDVSLQFFNDELRESIYFNPKLDSSWKREILNHQNFNGMRLSCLPLSQVQNNLILICSNGQNSWGTDKMEETNIPIYLINSGYNYKNNYNSNYYYDTYDSRNKPLINQNLKNCIEQTGGQILNLQNLNANTESWLKSTQFLKRYILKLETTSGKKANCNTLLPAEDHVVQVIYGEKTGNNDSLIITYNQVAQNLTTVEKIAIGSDNTSLPIERANIFYYSANRKNALLWNEELLWGIKEGVATYYTSFIVLEKIEDYIRFNIAPPKELEAACKEKGFVYIGPKEQYYNAAKRIEANYKEKIYKLLEQKNRLLNLQKSKPKEAIPSFDNTYAINEKIEKAADKTGDYATKPNTNALTKRASSKEITEDIVVIGYGTMKRRDMAGCSVTIRYNELQSSPNLATALQGRVAGLYFTTNSGNSPTINIRGSASINGGNQPLYIFDGLEISSNDIQYINTNNISTITIFKTTQAAAIYGSRGNNGVIIITSKKPNTALTYDYSKGTKIKKLEDEEYYTEMNEANNNDLEAIYNKYAMYKKHDASFMLDAIEMFFKKGNNEKASLLMQEYLKIFSSYYTSETLAVNILMQSKKYFIAKNLMSSYQAEMETNPTLAAHYITSLQKTGQLQEAITFGNNIIKKILENKAANEYSLVSLIILVKNLEKEVDATNKNYTRIKISTNSFNNHNFTLKYNGQNEAIIKTYLKAEHEFKDSLNSNLNNKYYNQNYYYNYYNTENANNLDYILENGKGKIKIMGNAYFNNYYDSHNLPTIVQIEITRNFGSEKETIESYAVSLENIRGTELEIFDAKIF